MRKKGCEIEAIGVNYTIRVPNPNRINPFSTSYFRRRILKDVSCRAKPFEILAIVGPSGAGKTSLLSILAGKLSPDAASISVNHVLLKPAAFRRISGHVPQKDALFHLLTVEETLAFSAKLRLGIPSKEARARVKTLIRELGLSAVARSRVGGISGGERRRVSIGVAVMHDPRVLILDEPTSGLDSCSAVQIVELLKVMAESRGRTVVLSIHQPGFRIVKMFGSILLLADGYVLHQGTANQLEFRLGLIGLDLPLHVNIIEFAMDSIETLRDSQHLLNSNQQIVKDENNIFTLQQLFQIDEADTIETLANNGFANSPFRESIILIDRFSKNIYRTRELFACRTLQMFLVGLVLSSIFYHVRDDLVGAEERLGLFAFVLTFLLSSTIEALPIFLQEREILATETSIGSYRVSSYVIANSLVYIPFLLILAFFFALPLYWLVGLNPDFTAFAHFLLLIWLVLYTANSVVVCFSALVPDFIIGNSVISGVLGSFFLFSGYFISKEGIPKYWMFMHYLSVFKYPFEGFVINEFSGSKKCLDYMFGKCMMEGGDLLREEGYREWSLRINLMIMVCFILAYRFASYVILRFRCS